MPLTRPAGLSLPLRGSRSRVTGDYAARTLPALRLNAATGRLPLPLFFADSRYFPEAGGQGQRIGQKWHKSSDPLYPGYSRSLKISQKRAVRCTLPVIIVAKWRAGPATPKYHSAFWQVAGPGGPQPRRNCLIFARLPDLRISSWQQAGAERAAPSSPAQRPSCNRRAAYLRGGGADAARHCFPPQAYSANELGNTMIFGDSDHNAYLCGEMINRDTDG